MSRPGEFGLNDPLPSASLNALPGGVLGYAQRTSDISDSTSSFVDVVTRTVDVVSNRLVRVSFVIPFATNTVGTTGRYELAITDGANNILQASWHRFGSTNAEGGRAFWVVDEPSAGAITYKGRFRSVGGTLTLGASATNPIQLLVEDIGPA